MNEQMIRFYEAKLVFETDAWDLYEALQAGEPLVVVDARPAEAYAREHIPGALNLPHRELSEAAAARLDKSLVYVTYCDGVGCNASTKGAIKLAKLGFRVKELSGGLDWWKRDGYATEGTEGRAGKLFECGC